MQSLKIIKQNGAISINIAPVSHFFNLYQYPEHETHTEIYYRIYIRDGTFDYMKRNLFKQSVEKKTANERKEAASIGDFKIETKDVKVTNAMAKKHMLLLTNYRKANLSLTSQTKIDINIMLVVLDEAIERLTTLFSKKPAETTTDKIRQVYNENVDEWSLVFYSYFQTILEYTKVDNTILYEKLNAIKDNPIDVVIQTTKTIIDPIKSKTKAKPTTSEYITEIRNIFNMLPKDKSRYRFYSKVFKMNIEKVLLKHISSITRAAHDQLDYIYEFWSHLDDNGWIEEDMKFLAEGFNDNLAIIDGGDANNDADYLSQHELVELSIGEQQKIDDVLKSSETAILDVVEKYQSVFANVESDGLLDLVNEVIQAVDQQIPIKTSLSIVTDIINALKPILEYDTFLKSDKKRMEHQFINVSNIESIMTILDFYNRDYEHISEVRRINTTTTVDPYVDVEIVDEVEVKKEEPVEFEDELAEYPDYQQMILLNFLHNAVVKYVTSTQTYIIGRGEDAKTDTITSNDLVFVGFLTKPQYMLEILSVGEEIVVMPYEDSIESVPPTKSILVKGEPISVAVSDFLTYSSSYREERHGKYYCVFYINKIPHAADDDHIYTLDTKNKNDPNHRVIDVVADIATIVESGQLDVAQYVQPMENLYNLSTSIGSYINKMSYNEFIINRPTPTEEKTDRGFMRKLLPAEIEKINRDAYDKYLNSFGSSTTNSIGENIKGLYKYFNVLLNKIDSEFISKLGIIAGSLLNVKGYDNILSQFIEQKNNNQINRASYKRFADPYTYEALRYAFNITKVNIIAGKDDKLNPNNSTHAPETYVCITVRTPLDITYNPNINVAYDIRIRSTNINPRPPLIGLMNNAVIYSKEYDKGKPTETRVEYNDRAWIRNFVCNQKFARKSLQTVEVYDEKTRSKILYCTSMSYAYEVLTGRSLNMFHVKSKIEAYERDGYASYNGYFVPKKLLPRNVINYIITKSNSYFNYYLRHPISDITITNNATIIVKQRLREIAYTIFCRLRASFGKYQDVTMAINNETNKRSPFVRSTIQTTHKENLGSRLTINEKGFYFGTIISAINEKTSENQIVPCLVLSPPTQFIATRTLQLDKNKIAEYYGILEEAIYSEQSAQFIMKRVDRPSSEYVNIWPKVYVPDGMKAAIITNILSGHYTNTVSPSDLQLFRLRFKERNYNKQDEVAVSVKTYLGLTYERNEQDTIIINDSVTGEQTIINFPIRRDAEIVTTTDQYEDSSYDDFFTDHLDMTFICLLEHALYGEDKYKLTEKLFELYNTYGSQEFQERDLGTFLHSELSERRLTQDVIKRVYHLLAFNTKNLIVKTNSTVLIRDNYYIDQESTKYLVCIIDWN